METTTDRQSKLFSDIKSLFKALVLISNVVPVLTGFWLALFITNSPFIDYWGLFIITMIGSTFMMGGALVINNWYDVDIDTLMDRTKQRPTVTGSIPLPVVLWIGIIFSIIGFIFLFFTNIEVVLYALVGWVTYVFPYTMWSKRRYTINTVIGSVSGAVTPLIGWAAIQPGLHPIPILLFLLIFIWQMPHTYAIAMRKSEEYRAAGVAMLPVVRGFRETKWHMFVYVLCLLPIPFFLWEIGTFFVVIATIFNLGWIGLSLYGFRVKDDFKWARVSFLYSVNYLMILFILMIIVTLPVFQ
ncbi:heme o synthase [Evansella sp. AB-P1]|uniref:heme o synthase n=1 Tax=Evansella sp. AB-P1 TaxID=3037653 RepID=UPI00241EBD94|nr:heme o synthase [Evansella sp. AB-P1]MDG5785976.1 heme o synthase [Evansella sp. AB-P1]